MQRWFLALLPAVAIALMGCHGGASEPVRATAPDGTFSFELTAPAHEEGNADKHLWRLPDGVVVSAQTIAKTDTIARDRGIDDVAGAIATQYRLGAVRGVRPFTPCTVRGRAARCAAGEIEANSESYHRESVLLERENEFVLVDVTGRPGQTDAVAQQRRLLTSSYRETHGGA